MKKLAIVAAAVGTLFASQLALAESDVNTAAGPSTAAARLDFEVVIPRVLFLQVGTGSSTPRADDTTVDMISFTVPAADLGSGLDIAGTGGDLGAGAVNVRLFGNAGDITLSAASSGGLDLETSAGDTLPWTEIKVTTAAGTTANGYVATAIPHPTINAAGTVITAASKVVRQHGTWTFAYDNSTTYAAGTYGGMAGNNRRVTYTVALP